MEDSVKVVAVPSAAVPVTGELVAQTAGRWSNIHPKVGASAFAGAVIACIIAFGKARWNLDLSGQESNLTMIVMTLVGWLMPGADQ